MCVQVCPVGIDIRDGLQYECIGCTACIDACDSIMDKVGYPRGLIRYTTANELENPAHKVSLWQKLRRPQVWIFSVMMIVVAAVTWYSLNTHQPVKANIKRERNTLVRELENGELENVYRVQLQNTAERARTFTISATGLPNLIVDAEQSGRFTLAATDSNEFVVRVRAARKNAPAGAHKIHFILQATDDAAITISEEASFFGK
jgi:cytochrome c oxidase accessory protein FixG